MESNIDIYNILFCPHNWNNVLTLQKPKKRYPGKWDMKWKVIQIIYTAFDLHIARSSHVKCKKINDSIVHAIYSINFT